jgi:hypothetical protein
MRNTAVNGDDAASDQAATKSVAAGFVHFVEEKVMLQRSWSLEPTPRSALHHVDGCGVGRPNSILSCADTEYGRSVHEDVLVRPSGWTS